MSISEVKVMAFSLSAWALLLIRAAGHLLRPLVNLRLKCGLLDANPPEELSAITVFCYCYCYICYGYCCMLSKL